MEKINFAKVEDISRLISNGTLILLLAILLISILAPESLAGTGGSGLGDDVYEQVKEWAQSGLVKIVVLIGFLVGAGVWMFTSNAMFGISVIVGSILLFKAPDFVELIAGII